MEPFDEHVKRLRQLYVKATPRQRLKVCLDRVKNPECGPNRLIQMVSAVEGLARTLVLHKKVANGTHVEKAYNEVKYANPICLVQCCLGTEPSLKFRNGIWETFKSAIQYRNLLIQ